MILEQLKTQEVHETLTDLKQAVVNAFVFLAKFSSQLEDVTRLVTSTLIQVDSSSESKEKSGMLTYIIYFKF